MALIKCPECEKDISDKSTNCIHCGYPLEHTSDVSKEEPKETRVVIQSLSKTPEKIDIAISIICDVTEMTQIQAKMLLEKDVIIVKENITFEEAKTIAERFISVDINAATYHSSIPRNWGCMTMETKKKDEEIIKKLKQEKSVGCNLDKGQKYSTSPNLTNQLKCPVCDGVNIIRITTMDRVFSVGIVGLASGKIGKQYRCKNCKHMW